MPAPGARARPERAVVTCRGRGPGRRRAERHRAVGGRRRRGRARRLPRRRRRQRRVVPHGRHVAHDTRRRTQRRGPRRAAVSRSRRRSAQRTGRARRSGRDGAHTMHSARRCVVWLRCSEPSHRSSADRESDRFALQWVIGIDWNPHCAGDGAPTPARQVVGSRQPIFASLCRLILPQAHQELLDSNLGGEARAIVSREAPAIRRRCMPLRRDAVRAEEALSDSPEPSRPVAPSGDASRKSDKERDGANTENGNHCDRSMSTSAATRKVDWRFGKGPMAAGASHREGNIDDGGMRSGCAAPAEPAGEHRGRDARRRRVRGGARGARRRGSCLRSRSATRPTPRRRGGASRWCSPTWCSMRCPTSACPLRSSGWRRRRRCRSSSIPNGRCTCSVRTTARSTRP